MSTSPQVLEYDSLTPGVEHFDGGVRITLPPSPTAGFVFQSLELVAGVLVCGSLGVILMALRLAPFIIPALLLTLALVTLWRFASFLRNRRRQRVIEAAHGMLWLRHLRTPEKTYWFPLRTVVAVRAEGCWSIVPPLRRTCLRVHFRTRASLKLLDEVDTPDVLRLAELLDEIVQAGLRPPNPDTQLESAVAVLRRPDSGN